MKGFQVKGSEREQPYAKNGRNHCRKKRNIGQLIFKNKIYFTTLCLNPILLINN